MYSLAREGDLLNGTVYSSLNDEAEISMQKLTVSQAIEAIERDQSRIVSLEKALKGAHAETKRQKDKYQTQIQQFQKHINKFVEETQALETKNKKLRQKHLRVIEENRKKVEQIRAECQKLKAQLTNAKIANQKSENEYKAKINKLNNTINKLEREIKSRAKQIERLQSKKKMPALFMKDVLRYNYPDGLYTRIIAENPESDLALVAQAGIAFIHLANGNDEQVLVEYDKLLAEYKGLPMYSHHTYIIPQEYYDMAKAAKRQGHKEVATANYKKAITLWEKVDLKDINAYLGGATLYTLGNSCNFTRETRKAIEYYERLLKEYPESGYVLGTRFYLPGCARALKRKNPAMADEADVMIEKYLKELIDNHSDSHYYQQSLKKLAVFYFNKKQYAQALERFEQLVEKYPKERKRHSGMMSQCRQQLAETKEDTEIKKVNDQISK